MKTISTSELRERLDAGPVALFDVRGDVTYESAHIPGAKTAPLGSLVFRVARVMNPDSFIALYSEGLSSSLATEAAERLEGLGMRNVHVYREGVEGWQNAGYDLVESPSARIHARGPVEEVRALVIDRNTAYGGAFLDTPTAVDSAGG